MTDNLQFLLPDANKTIKARHKYYVMTLTNCAINLHFTLAIKLIT